VLGIVRFCEDVGDWGSHGEFLQIWRVEG